MIGRLLLARDRIGEVRQVWIGPALAHQRRRILRAESDGGGRPFVHDEPVSLRRLRDHAGDRGHRHRRQVEIRIESEMRALRHGIG